MGKRTRRISSNKGLDFRTVLEEVAEAEIPMPDGGRWAAAGMVELPERQIAWRVLDAQHWGVPQRRKRIFLVADFNGKRAGEILFKPESLSGDFAQGGEKREGITENPERSLNEAIGVDFHNQSMLGNNTKTLDSSGSDYSHIPCVLYPPKTVGSLVARADGSPCIDRGQPFVVTAGFLAGQGSKAGSIGYQEEVPPTLLSGGNSVPSIVVYPDIAGTLCASGAGLSRLAGQCNETDLCIVRAKAINQNADGEVRESDVAYTISANSNPSGRNAPLVYSFDSLASNSMKSQNPHSGCREIDIAKTIDTSSQDPSKNQGGVAIVYSSVRRLTPTECARLQGFPRIIEVDKDMTRDEWIVTALSAGYIFTDINTGDVYRTRGQGGRILKIPEKLKGTILPSGYKVISIKMNGHKKQCRINRVIWISAYGIPPDGYVVDHKNNDKLDNRLSNLQAITQKDNSTKAREDELYRVGDDSPQSKISGKEHKNIAEMYFFGNKTMKEIAQHYGLSQSRIQQIIREKEWCADIPHSDTTEYKMWGNGMALNCIMYIMQNIAEICK